ncbi:MAG: hypothetical protein H6832_10595 [Planctomycetes bacterium]|nr:hypothetical protein [Planctomycetota bacterium]MCB9918838.1 hypothetical protein [Planctomycetota bacterium]
MEKNVESGSAYTRRHLSQLKILSRLLEHELELAKGDEVVIEKSLLESSLDLIDIFVDDLGGAEPRASAKERKMDGKAQVTRLN